MSTGAFKESAGRDAFTDKTIASDVQWNGTGNHLLLIDTPGIVYAVNKQTHG